MRGVSAFCLYPFLNGYCGRVEKDVDYAIQKEYNIPMKDDKEIKDGRLQIRTTQKEIEEIIADAERHGFKGKRGGKYGDFLLFLYRKYGKRKEI